jgi:NADH-ubiquinone oxidoreductase chain 6
MFYFLKMNEFKIYIMSFLIPDIESGFNPMFIYIIIGIALVSGILIITSKNPIISVLYLILLFGSISCYLILIGLKFIGISYLLVYVGAVSILFLFILMLINIRVSELISDTSNSIPLSIICIISFYIPLIEQLPGNQGIYPNKESINHVSSSNWDGTISDVSDITSIGNIMYTSHSMWLIITSIILLLSMVGSIIITIKQKY